MRLITLQSRQSMVLTESKEALLQCLWTNIDGASWHLSQVAELTGKTVLRPFQALGLKPRHFLLATSERLGNLSLPVQGLIGDAGRCAARVMEAAWRRLPSLTAWLKLGLALLALLAAGVVRRRSIHWCHSRRTRQRQKMHLDLEMDLEAPQTWYSRAEAWGMEEEFPQLEGPSELPHMLSPASLAKRQVLYNGKALPNMAKVPEGDASPESSEPKHRLIALPEEP